MAQDLISLSPMLLAAITALLSTLTTGASLPTLCVEIPREEGLPFTDRDLLPALRARINRRQLSIAPCAVVKAPTWRLLAHRDGKAAVVQVDGRGIPVQRTFQLEGVPPDQLTQAVAMAMAEDVRPAIDQLLAELGLPIEAEPISETSGAALANLEAQVSTGVAQPMPPPATSIGPSLALTAGAVGGIDDVHVGPAAKLEATLPIGSFGLSLSLGGRVILRAERAGVTLGGEAFDLGLNALARLGLVLVGVGARARLTLFHFAGEGVAQSGQYWDGAVEVQAQSWPIVFGRWHIGAVAQVSVWLQPRRVLAGEQTVYRQSIAELFIGPAVRFSAK